MAWYLFRTHLFGRWIMSGSRGGRGGELMSVEEVTRAYGWFGWFATLFVSSQMDDIRDVM